MVLAALHRWLVTAFTDAELRRVVRFGPWGAQVAACLPASCSLDALAFEVVTAWSRHDLIKKPLFKYLARERPCRAGSLPKKMRERADLLVSQVDSRGLNFKETSRLHQATHGCVQTG